MGEEAEKTQLELYKRALELAKNTFGLAETSVKIIEEKGRNNITLTPTVLGFVVVVLRPDSVGAKFNWINTWQVFALLTFAGAVTCVIWAYIEFLTIVRPTQAYQIDPNWIIELPEKVSSEVGFVASELGIFQVYIQQSQDAIKKKSKALDKQTTAMVSMIVFVVLYLGFSVVYLATL